MVTLSLDGLRIMNPEDKIKWSGNSSNTEPIYIYDRIRAIATASRIDSINSKELDKGTAVAIKEKHRWDKIPKYSDYVNLEELYDVDEIDELYYQASKKRGW